VALVLTHAVLPKDLWLADSQVAVPWPVFGIPDALHVDNGAEFLWFANIPIAVRIPSQTRRAD
jgi:hypothetical protein